MQRLSDTGSSVQTKVKINISLEVETIDFDVQSSEIRLKGRNMEENEHIKVRLVIQQWTNTNIISLTPFNGSSSI